MDELAKFLRARLDEEEAAATPGRRALDDLRFDLKRGDPYEQHLSSRIEDGLDIQTGAWHAWVRGEVEAKRAILEDECLPAATGYDPGHPDLAADVRNDIAVRILRHLAAVYRDHPDYRPEWE